MSIPEIRTTRRLLAALVLASGLVRVTIAGDAPDGAKPADGWAYLDNGQIRLGVKTASGGGIGYLSVAGSARNLLNHFDRGRLVQQSYYGNPDG